MRYINVASDIYKAWFCRRWVIFHWFFVPLVPLSFKVAFGGFGKSINDRLRGVKLPVGLTPNVLAFESNFSFSILDFF